MKGGCRRKPRNVRFVPGRFLGPTYDTHRAQKVGAVSQKSVSAVSRFDRSLLPSFALLSYGKR